MNKKAALGAALLIVAVAFWAGRYTGKNRISAEQGRVRRVLYYVDPMHPAYRSDKPGIAPDCGMALEPVYAAEDSMANANVPLPPGAVSISPDKQQLIGVRIETVDDASGSQLIRTSGRVVANDNQVYRLMAATEGWVQSLQNTPAGTVVKKNDLLATFYSREFRNVEQAYLGSLASLDRLKRAPEEGSGSDANLRINEEQLHALGMGDPQIKELAKSHQLTRNVEITSPIDGVVLERSISPMQRFDKGAELYRIADLTRIWILADLYDNEAKALRPGSRVKVTVRELAKTMYATVGENPPLFDPASRTLKLRLEADNPGSLLRPDMFVDLEFNSKISSGVSISQEAVLDSGRRKIVYVETADNVFEPRPVETGAVHGDRVTILRGLEKGDRVVASGNFLIDSESRIRSARIVSNNSNAEVATSGDAACGMQLDAKRLGDSQYTAKYKGETFAFSSEKCQRQFEQDPAKYAGDRRGSMAVPSGGSRRLDD